MASIDSVVYTTSSYDPTTRLPLVIVNSINFQIEDDENSVKFMSQFLEKLPKTPYALIFFACGAPNKPSWAWITKIYGMLSRDMKKRVGRVYVVHESWWVRAITEMFKGITSSKFSSKMVHISSLTELSTHLDITEIEIPPEVYLYNAKVECKINVPKYSPPVFGVPLRRNGNDVQYPAMWHDCCQYLRVAGAELNNIFELDDNNDMTYILKDAYDRSQLLDLRQYDPHHVAGLIKLYLKLLPNPLLHPNYLETNTFITAGHCVEIYQSLPFVTQKFLYDLMEIFCITIRNNVHTSETIALCMAPCFLGQFARIHDNKTRTVRFIRSLIELWSEVGPIVRPHDFDTPDSTTSYTSSNASKESLSSIMSRRAVSSSSISSTEDHVISQKNNYNNNKLSGAYPKLYSSDYFPAPPKRSMSTSPVKLFNTPTLRKSASTTFSKFNQTGGGSPIGPGHLYSSKTFSEGVNSSRRASSGSIGYMGRSVSTKRSKRISELAKLYE